MNCLSLFSGIGGLDLGLERTGITVIGQVERDPFRRSILARHWPGVPRHDDVRTAANWWSSEPRPAVRVVAGGFPCQPFSTAGLRRGTTDQRWGWPWMLDVIRALRPEYVVVENVAALLDDADAFGWVLGDLADLGFDARWGVLSACAMGAPHMRDRLFLVAHTNSGDGQAGLGHRPLRPEPVPPLDDRARAWRDHVAGALEASRADDRETNGLARQMVAAAGDAVVVPVAEFIGRLIVAAENDMGGGHG